MAGSSSLTITELGSAPGDKPRKVVLIGSGLPYMGAEWGGQLSLSTTWYPGNDKEATQQVLGPQVLPTTWSGGWHRTMLGKTPALCTTSDGFTPRVSAPTDLVNVLEGMFRAGRRLQVVWATEQEGSAALSQQITRVGRAKTWRWRYRTEHDVEWEISWEWLARNLTTPRVLSTRPKTITQMGAEYEAKLQALVDAAAAAQAAKFAPHPITLGQLEAFANTPALLAERANRSVLQLQHELGQITSIASTLASQPQAIANTAINHARNARSQAKSVYRSFSASGVETLSKKGDAASVLHAHKTFGDIQEKSLDMQRAAMDFEVGVRQSVAKAGAPLSGQTAMTTAPPPGSILAAVVCKQGDTPKSLSMRYFGSPDHDVDILKANRMAWYLATFTPGQIVVIPVLAGVAPPTSV